MDSEIVIVAYSENKVVGFAALVNDSVAENFHESPFLDFLFVEKNIEIEVLPQNLLIT